MAEIPCLYKFFGGAQYHEGEAFIRFGGSKPWFKHCAEERAEPFISRLRHRFSYLGSNNHHFLSK